MRARILAFDTPEHRRAELLLPWYIAGTLDPDERACVEAHLPGCARCRSDLAFQARLRAAPDAQTTSDGVDRDWSALLDRLAPKPPRSARATARGPQRWVARWWPMALAFQAAVLAGLAVALVIALQRPEPYRALGAGTSAPAANVLVVFRPDATEAQIRAALRSSGARLLDGPTVTDAYLLQLPESAGPQALADLRAQAAVLQAESLRAAASP